MKNRDHTGIIRRGLKNFQATWELHSKPVRLSKEEESVVFVSYTEAAKFLAPKIGRAVGSVMDRLRRHRSFIHGWNVEYLNAETVHNGSTEQETVHEE